jgi:hypothetical protein
VLDLGMVAATIHILMEQHVDLASKADQIEEKAWLL